MNHALAYLGGFLVVILAALFAVPAFVDWNGYRGVFEEEASKVLGRDVRVGGGVNLRLLPIPYVKFEKVRLADVSGQTGEPFIRVESFTMRLSGPALLRGVFEATEIELNKPVLTLALDGAGGGNWSTISLKPGALPFVPRDVTLRSVKLIDGAISVYAPDATVVTRIEAINGELAADGLSGPFRFKGVAHWSGNAREIRFATTAMDADGFRIKAVSNAPATGNTFTVDGRVENFTSAPKLEGEISGRLAVPNGATLPSFNAAAKSVTKIFGGGETQAPTMELKAQLSANAGGAKLSDISLNLENAAEPQIITGAASATWAAAPRLDVALMSKWLDLDRLAGAGQDSAPFQKIKQLAVGVIEAVAGDGAAAVKIDIEQVKIGGETAGGLKIDAERRDGAVRLKELRAGLPGGSRLGLFGDIKNSEAGGLSFAGEGFVNGSNLARLKAWAEKSGAAIDIGPDGAFSAEGQVRMSGLRFELTEASAEIGGRAMTGEVKIFEDGRRRAEITVESAQLESDDLLPDTTRALDTAIRKAIGLAAPGAPIKSEIASGDGDKSAGLDIVLRVLTGELKHGAATYRDVDATIAFENGNIRVPSAKFVTADGLAIAVDGRIDNKGGVPTGVIAFDASGESPAAMRDLVRLFGLDGLVSTARAERLGGAKLAGLIRLGGRGAKTADVSVDGLLAGARLSVNAAFETGLADWRRQPVQLHVAIIAPGVIQLAAALGASAKPTSPATGRPLDLALTISGALEKGAAARLDIKGDRLAANYEGSLAWSDGKAIDANGKLRISAGNVDDALAITGLTHASGVSPVAVQGVIDVERQDGEWALATQGFKLGASSLKGALTMATGPDGGAVVAGDIAVDHILVAALLQPFFDAATSAPADAEAATGALAVDDAPRPTSWPDGRFNFSALDRLSGQIALSFTELTIGERLQAHNGRLSLVMAPGKLSLTNITGTTAGGALDGDVTLTASQSGVAGAAKIAIAGIDLATLGSQSRGKASLDLTLNGQAFSPVALIASTAGKGKLTLEGGRISGPAHGTAREVVDAVLQGRIENQPEPLSTMLKDALVNSVVDLGARVIDVTVSNGVATIAPIELQDDRGATTATASLDFGSWDITSIWKVAPTPTPLSASVDWPQGWGPGPARGPLPPLSIAFNGGLYDLGGLAASIEATSLQRDLSVRKMERHVEDLERVRRLDEERVRLERERRRALEEQRLKDAAEARAKRNGERLPPVSPESYNDGAPAPQSQRTPATPEPPLAGPAQSDAVQPAAAGDAAISTPATGSTAPPATADIAIEAGATPPVGDPSLDVRPRPVYKPRAPRQAAPRRTPSDEVLRSLGAIP